jgi:O-antigen/teichoic acid export membrane protein
MAGAPPQPDTQPVHDGLGRSILRGTSWVAAGRIVVQLLSLLQITIVARYLEPGEVGTMAIALLVLRVLDVFTQSGFAQALVQRRGDIEPFLDSVYVANLVRGVVLGSLVFASAPVAAGFFRQDDATDVIRMAGLILVIRGIANPALVRARRNLQFGRVTLVDMAGNIVAFAVAVTLAPILRNVWALTLSLVAREVVIAVGSFMASPWMPHLRFHRERLGELYQFGRWVFVGNIMGFLSLQLDNLCVGRMLGAPALGLYEMAFNTSQIPATQLSQTVSSVAFPALSTVADTPERFRSIYLRMMSTLFMVNVVIAVVLLLGAEQIVRLFLGDDWLAAAPALRLLAIAGFLRSIVTVGGQVFQAAGHPRFDARMNGVRLAVLAVAVIPAIDRWGIEGAAVAVIASMVAVVPMFFLLVNRAIGVTPLDHLRALGSGATALAARLRLGRT